VWSVAQEKRGRVGGKKSTTGSHKNFPRLTHLEKAAKSDNNARLKIQEGVNHGEKRENRRKGVLRNITKLKKSLT